MDTPRKLLMTAFAALSTTILAASAAAQAPTLTLDQPLYEVGQTATSTISGTAGDFAWLLVDPHKGSTYVPGIGTVDIDMSPGMMVVPLGKIPGTGSISSSITPHCTSPAAWQPFFMQGVTLGRSPSSTYEMSNLVVLDFVRGPDCHSFPEPPIGDPTWGNFPGGTSLWLPGVGQYDYVFLPGARYAENLDGTATLTGVAEGRYDPSKKFRVEVSLSGRVGPGDGIAFPPLLSPKKELKPGAYKEWNGPVDTGTWHYFETFSGTLYGLEDYAGGIIDIDRMGPSFQVGYGGDNVSLDYGASGWFNQNIRSQPSGEVWAPTGHGDFNFNIRDVEDTDPRCLRAPEDSQYATFPADVAVWLPGIATDFVLEPGSTYTEYRAGTARLQGEAYRPGNPSERFIVDILLSDRVAVGDPSYPPAGSPKKEMHPTAYIDWGGPVDPATWHYYESFVGLLIGTDAYAGGLVAVDRFGPSWQVGLGANNVNTKDGASGWFNQDVITTPAGYTWLPTGHGDFNFQFEDCPPAAGGGR